MQTITTIGLDIAKSVFQVHGVRLDDQELHDQLPASRSIQSGGDPRNYEGNLSAATSTGRAGVETASMLATLFAVDAAWTVLAPQRPNKTATDRFRPWQDTPLLRLS